MAVHPVFKPSNTAVITGAASGIGLALATKCASYDMNVLLLDNNAANLASAHKSLAPTAKGSIETLVVDVSSIGDFDDVKKVVEEKFDGKIHLLALNAGIGLRGSWGDIQYFQKIMSVNLFGVINGVSALLPLVTSTSTSSSAIVITGSKQGITNPPGNPAYNASKAAVKTLAEHLSFDLATSSPSTSVHLLIPGWTFTGLSGNAPFPNSKGEEVRKEKPAGAWTADQVVEFLGGKMGEGKFYVVCPDNDVDEATDRRRMLWAANEVVSGRQPLGRWRKGGKEVAEEWMAKQDV